MSQDMLELHLTNLLVAIQQSKHGILTESEAAELVGEENLEPLRAIMIERKFLMPPLRKNKGGFELTFAGLLPAAESLKAEVLSEDGELTEEGLLEIMLRNKALGPPEVWTKEDPLRVYPSRGGKACAYLLPVGNTALFTELVQSIPFGWNRAHGELRAPADLVVAGEASAHGGLSLGLSRQEMASDQDERQSGPYARILPSEQYDPMIAKVRFDLLDLMARHKLPGFIRFDEAGSFGRLSDFPFRSVLAVAVAYVARGYLGNGCFYAGSLDDSHSPAAVEVKLGEWVENDFGIRTNRPPVAEISWSSSNDRKLVDHIIELCRSYDLAKVPVKIE